MTDPGTTDGKNRKAASTADILGDTVVPAPASEPIQPPYRTRNGEPVCPDCHRPYRVCRCGMSED